MDNNIHAPAIPSGPATIGTGSQDASKLSMVELMTEKERIELELSALSSVLSSVSPSALQSELMMPYSLR
jgi:26S proteasome regulatory subunit N4